MAINVRDYFPLVRLAREAPAGEIWSSYDEEADVLYVKFDESAIAEDSELTDDDVILRFANGQIVGLTILHASKRDEVRQ